MSEAEERRKKREAAESAAAASGKADDEVADRFGKDEPVFGQGVQVPAAPVNVTPESNATVADNPIGDRFTN